MKFALNENTLITCGLSEFLQASAEAGFTAVELSYPKVKEALRFIPADTVRQLIGELGLQILSLNAFEDVFLVPESGLAAVETEARLIGELCTAIGCPAVILPSSRWYSRYGELPEADELYSIYGSRLLLFKHIFSEYDVELLFEPIAYPEFVLGSVDEVNRVMDHPELTELRIVPDIHNLFRNRQGPQQLPHYRNAIGLFHIDDTVTGDLDSLDVARDRTYPGKGVAGAAEWVRQAGRLGYSGYFSLELFSEELYAMDAGRAAALCMRQLREFEQML